MHPPPCTYFPPSVVTRSVRLHPECSGADRHRRLRLHGVLASIRHERIVHLDVVHVARPDQQRVGRVGRALVAVAAAFDRETQVIFACEIHSRGNVLGVARRDRIHAGLRSPRIDPSQGFCEPRRIADEVGIFEVLREFLGGVAIRIGLENRKREVHLDQVSADRFIELLPRRLRWPCGIGRTAPTKIRRARPQPARQNRQQRRRSDRPQECSSVHCDCTQSRDVT